MINQILDNKIFSIYFCFQKLGECCANNYGNINKILIRLNVKFLLKQVIHL